MAHQIWILRFVTVFVLCAGSLANSAEELTVSGKIVFPEMGLIVVALITEQEFNERVLHPDNPYVLTIEPDSQQIAMHQVTFMFRDVSAGPYTVGCYQDVNRNRQLDTNLWGLPKEPWGLYHFSRSLFHLPTFEEVSLMVITQVTNLQVEIR